MDRIKIIAYQGDRQLICLASHVTNDGMQVYSPAEGKLGQYMRLVFELSNGQWIDVDALLISQTRHAEHYRWGLSFLNLSAEVRQQLQALVQAVDDEAPTAGVRPRASRRHTSRYRIARRLFQDDEVKTPGIEPVRPSDPAPRHEPALRHVGYKTGTAPTVPERAERETSEVPLPPPRTAAVEPAVRRMEGPIQRPPAGAAPPGAEQPDLRSQLAGFEEDATPLEEIYRRALRDLKRRRF
jgi:hypothetical protein